MKVLINSCYGGFGYSEEFVEHLITKNLVPKTANSYNIPRDNQEIIEEAIKFGLEKANGWASKLEVVEILDGAQYSINEYDGFESIDDVWIEVTLDELKNGLSSNQLSMVSQGCNIKLAKLTEADFFWDGDESIKNLQ